MLATLAVAPLAAGAVARSANSDNKTFKPTESSREKLRKRYFPNFELTTHDGKKVHFYDDLIKDKIVVINFMYAKCEGICMPITMNLKRVQKLLGDRVGRDIFMYSVTLKPEEDTPRALKQYVRAH
ncbi:MAG TPA: SCO family protein, partial [Pyrinomonadaceae bacterium]|nr:SCO family protein [Pyrinomonadaceae bacterium]